MTVFYPGPQVLEMIYTVSGLEHKMRMNVEATTTPSVGDGLGSIDLVRRNATTQDALSWLLSIEDLLEHLYDNVNMSFDTWNLYNVAPSSYDFTFVKSYNSVELPVNVADYVSAHHRIFTFRTQGGNLAKLYLMETSLGQNDLVGYSSLLSVEQDLVDLLVADNTCMIGRDGEHVSTLVKRGGSQNEKLFRLRNR